MRPLFALPPNHPTRKDTPTVEMMLTDAPKLTPFKCLDGTAGGEGPVVDTLITTRTPGRVYLSGRDVRNAARLLGYLEPSQGDELRGEMAAQAALVAERDARISELEGELAELQDVRAAITRAADRWNLEVDAA